METICVDIGNSGLRCVRLTGSPAAGKMLDAAATTPWSGEVLRIDWPPAGDDGRLQADDAQLAVSTLSRAIEPWLQAFNGSVSLPLRRQWIVSSVQRATETHLRACAARLGASDYHLVSHSDLDLEVDVDFPHRVGIDRLLAALAAMELTPVRPLIVIQAGSAITVDWVESPRRFCGGAIMPGVPMMLRLLSQAADLLPRVAADELLELVEDDEDEGQPIRL